MEETRNTPAVILSRQDYRESDSLVTVYTPDRGKLQLIARGTKKPQSKLAGHIEPITLADIMIIRGRGFDYLGSALTRTAYHGIRSELNKIYYAGRAVSLYRRQTEENPGEERLFWLLTSWLEILDKQPGEPEFAKEKGELMLAIMAFNFLSLTGHRPQLRECLDCRRPVEPGENHFDLLNGGIVCGSCRTIRRDKDPERNRYLLPISDNGVKIVRFILENDLAASMRLRADRRTLKEFSALAAKFLDFVKSE